MVAMFGHLAMGLLWAAPAWFLWDGRVSLAFIAFVVSTSLLPDADLVLKQVLPGVHHHGVTHTVLFVVVIGVLVGVIAKLLSAGLLRRWLARDGAGHPSTLEVYAFASGGFMLGGLSHIFADLLSAPDIAQPLEPFWPFYSKPFSVDLLYYGDPVWNLGLFVFAIALHLVLALSDIGPAWFSRGADAAR